MSPKKDKSIGTCSQLKMSSKQWVWVVKKILRGICETSGLEIDL